MPNRIFHLPLLLLFLGIHSSVYAQSPAPIQATPPAVLRQVHIESNNIFTPEEAAENRFYRAGNFIHVPTRDQVIRNHVWLEPGDPVTDADVAELERELRLTRLFAEVAVTRVPVPGSPGETDLQITTRDTYTLRLSVGGSFVGGVTTWFAVAGDRNFLGTGNHLRFETRQNDEDEEVSTFTYEDRHVLDRDVDLSLVAGWTEEGPLYSIGLGRPFRHLQDEWSWRVSSLKQEDEIDFFAGGESFAEVPRDIWAASANLTRAFPENDGRRRWWTGATLGGNITDYQPATGPGAAEITVPNDLQRLSLTHSFGLDELTDRRRIKGLDTLDFVQDIDLGWFPSVYYGGLHRDEETLGDKFEFLAGGRLRAAIADDDARYLTAQAGLDWRYDSDRTQGWSGDAALHAYQRFGPRQTFAASLTYDQIFEGEDLSTQLTLGEDNGLRGFPAREFGGQRRFRLNLEHRLNTGLHWGGLHLGVIGLLDAAWIDKGVVEPDDLLAAVGGGLRIASSEWLGTDVIRIDLAVPINGGDADPRISFALGQVFTFFGNDSVLRTR